MLIQGLVYFFVITASTYGDEPLDHVPHKMDSFSSHESETCRYDNILEREDSAFGRCADGSISYSQPKGKRRVPGRIVDYLMDQLDLRDKLDLPFDTTEGLCGPTAGANLFHMYCNMMSRVRNYIYPFMDDTAPGVGINSLRNGLNAIFRRPHANDCPDGRWKRYSAPNKAQYMKSLKDALRQTDARRITQTTGRVVYRSPVATLINTDPDEGSIQLHWVTVTDIEEENGQCTVFANTWRDQYRVDCEDFANYASAMLSYDVIHFHAYPLTMIWFDPE